MKRSARTGDQHDLPAAVEYLYHSPDLRKHRAAVQVWQGVQQARLGGDQPHRRAAEVEVTVDPAVPAMAWCCDIEGARHRFVLGAQVEQTSNGFFEGVWDGDFAQGDFHRTEFAFGSGAQFGDEVVFVPPKHCWESLTVIHDKGRDRVVVSNSMNFAFSRAGVAVPGPFFRRVARVLRAHNDAATRAGLDRYDPLVAENRDFAMYQFMFTNFSVRPGGKFRLHPSRPDQYFRSFVDYTDFLRGVIRSVADNGADRRRAIRMTPGTPISGGYDSPCVGALAAELDHRDAVTIGVVVKGRDDSGVEIGKNLGLDVDVVPHVFGTHVPRLATDIGEDLSEDVAEFVATPGLGDDVMLLPMAAFLRHRIMLSGAMGDSAWRRPPRLAPGLPVGVRYGKSLTEFRLRVGFAFVPVPAIGARFPWPIRRITRSPEMAPYTLYEPYDRPIARRVVEEAGIQRGTFARAKAATNPTILNHGKLFPGAVARTMRRYVTATA